MEEKEIEVKIYEIEIKNKKQNKKDKKKFTILGFSIWRIFAYFIIYSVLGYVIETIFGIITKGTWESRQSFLYGPFCRNIWTWCSYNDSISAIF